MSTAPGTEPLNDVLEPTEATALSRVVTSALKNGQLCDAAPAALFVDTAAFQTECRSLVAAFPERTLHGFAVKACPVVGVLRAAAEAGMGGECASEGEVQLCLAAGMEPSRIVLDSPCKTDTLLRKMIKLGVHLNADNLDEVGRIHAILQEDPNFADVKPSVGLRINPQIGSGTIGMTSTAGTDNKFGVPLRDQRAQLLDAFCSKYSSVLTGVHVHVGSQGVSPQQLVDGAKAMVELAQEINAKAGTKQVTTIDIGGGLSVYYGPSTAKNGMISMEAYASMLREQVPALFDHDFRIITELGRRMVAPYGFLATLVQTIKRNATRTYVVGHVGADLLLRDVYAPAQWRHAIHVYEPASQSFRGQQDGTAKFHVAGPLCFSGDIIAKDRILPAAVQEGDVLVMPMSGAYTISMYSRHTSQLVPAVYGYDGSICESDKIGFATLKKAETLDDLVRFWGG